MTNRRLLMLAALAAALLPFSSCTCGSTAAPVPVATAERRAGGFGAVITPRKLPERVAGVITPQQVEAPPVSPLPTAKATPDQSSLPDNFPEGIPVPTGSQVMAVQSLANDARNVIFATEDEAPQLFSLYKDSMTNSGWGKPTQEYQGHEQSFLSFKKGDTITNISVSKDPKTGKRIVAVMYYEEKPLAFPEF